MKCNQPGCSADAAYRYTWPGQHEAGICADHSERVRNTAGAMGFTCELIALDPLADTGNKFMVAVQGEMLMFLRPIVGRLTKPEALNLAAWLVALADPGEELFRKILDKVRNA